MKLFLVSGKAQHGKDTFANILKEKLENINKKVLIVHFADLVKYTCKIFFNWDGQKDEFGRSLLQKVGTDKVRTKYPDFWVEYIARILNVFQDEWEYVIIPDCRFLNEINLLKDYKFDIHTFRIIRENFDNGLTIEQENHLSEISLDDYKFDSYIYNFGDIEDFKNIINKFFGVEYE